MDTDSCYTCWEMMNCDNLGCPARHEPETPCWEIAKQVKACHDVAKDCKDCLVYILKAGSFNASINKLKNLKDQEEFWERIGTRHQDCIVQANSMG